MLVQVSARACGSHWRSVVAARRRSSAAVVLTSRHPPLLETPLPQIFYEGREEERIYVGGGGFTGGSIPDELVVVRMSGSASQQPDKMTVSRVRSYVPSDGGGGEARRRQRRLSRQGEVASSTLWMMDTQMSVFVEGVSPIHSCRHLSFTSTFSLCCVVWVKQGKLGEECLLCKHTFVTFVWYIEQTLSSFPLDLIQISPMILSMWAMCILWERKSTLYLCITNYLLPRARRFLPFSATVLFLSYSKQLPRQDTKALIQAVWYTEQDSWHPQDRMMWKRLQYSRLHVTGLWGPRSFALFEHNYKAILCKCNAPLAPSVSSHPIPSVQLYDHVGCQRWPTRRLTTSQFLETSSLIFFFLQLFHFVMNFPWHLITTGIGRI